MEGSYTHRPVMLETCLEQLNIRPEGIYLDATLGRAGHSREIARRLGTGRLICVDRDSAALEAARELLAPWMDRVSLVHSNFDRLGEILEGLGLAGVDGILADLGVSSPQLDEGARGFSYQLDAPLDMRMDQSQGFSAFDLVNGYSQEELSRILWTYGEERYARQIAAAVVREREKGAIRTTLELVSIIRSALPPRALREKQHPAKRSFQAIRIAVNDELGSIERFLQQAVPRLRQGGRLVVMSFHSLEDRCVKQTMQRFAQGCTCPPDFPVCVCGKQPELRILTRKAITPAPEEISDNPRARSAKLRAAEKCQPQEKRILAAPTR